jgi:hypothetical protein
MMMAPSLDAQADLCHELIRQYVGDPHQPAGALALGEQLEGGMVTDLRQA